MLRKLTLAACYRCFPRRRWRWLRPPLRRAAYLARIITTTTGVRPGFGIGFVGGGGYDGCYRTRRVLTPYGYRYRTINVCAY